MVLPTPEVAVPTIEVQGAVQGHSPWYLAWLRLRRNKVGLAFGALFLLIVLFCLAAPLWADHVAHTGPNQNHITDKILIDGRQTDIVFLGRGACVHRAALDGARLVADATFGARIPHLSAAAGQADQGREEERELKGRNPHVVLVALA